MNIAINGQAHSHSVHSWGLLLYTSAILEQSHWTKTIISSCYGNCVCSLCEGLCGPTEGLAVLWSVDKNGLKSVCCGGILKVIECWDRDGIPVTERTCEVVMY